jgi:hypothetical protein
LKRTTTSVVEKGSNMVSSVGSSVQEKLDETGVSSGISYAVNSAAEKTSYVGSRLVETGSNLVSSGATKLGEV